MPRDEYNWVTSYYRVTFFSRTLYMDYLPDRNGSFDSSMVSNQKSKKSKIDWSEDPVLYLKLISHQTLF